jgi:hypothetical protein
MIIGPEYILTILFLGWSKTRNQRTLNGKWRLMTCSKLNVKAKKNVLDRSKSYLITDFCGTAQGKQNFNRS